MVFPIGDDQVKGGSYPAVSYSFIILNVLIFLYQLSNQAFTMGYSAIPHEILNNIDLVGLDNGIPHESGPNPIYLTLLFSQFMHGGIMHLIGNMVFLWVFADNIESTIGSVKFGIFYILGGIFASFGHIIFNLDSMIPSLGASGAIAAVLGAYMVMFPKSMIKTIVVIKVIRIPAFIFLGFWILYNVFNGVGASLAPESTGTAWWAHIGGFVFGVLAGWLFKNYTPMIVLEGEEYRSVKNNPIRYNNRFITNRIKNI